MMARRWLLPLLRWAAFMVLALGSAGAARANSCSIAPASVVFPAVSSISSGPVFASSNFTINCNWTNALLPTVAICLSAGAGSGNTSATAISPRQLKDGSLAVNYNLYTDNTYAAAKIWGGIAGTSPAGTAIQLSLTKPASSNSISQVVTIYGKLEADATLSGIVVGSTDRVFSSTFGAGSAVMQYQFLLSGLLGCAVLAQSTSIPFTVQAPVINDCNISVGALAFPNAGLLTSPVRATSSLTVRCSNNTAYSISLNAGTYGSSTTARRMKNQANTDTVAYELSTALDGASWGDGTGGTVAVTGTGNGTTATMSLYGRVPVQAGPSPGDYKDTVTATVSF